MTHKQRLHLKVKSVLLVKELENRLSVDVYEYEWNGKKKEICVANEKAWLPSVIFKQYKSKRNTELKK
jgi:hypothetical protein